MELAGSWEVVPATPGLQSVFGVSCRCKINVRLLSIRGEVNGGNGSAVSSLQPASPAPVTASSDNNKVADNLGGADLPPVVVAPNPKDMPVRSQNPKCFSVQRVLLDVVPALGYSLSLPTPGAISSTRRDQHSGGIGIGLANAHPPDPASVENAAVPPLTTQGDGDDDDRCATTAAGSSPGDDCCVGDDMSSEPPLTSESGEGLHGRNGESPATPAEAPGDLESPILGKVRQCSLYDVTWGVQRLASCRVQNGLGLDLPKADNKFAQKLQTFKPSEDLEAVEALLCSGTRWLRGKVRSLTPFVPVAAITTTPAEGNEHSDGAQTAEASFGASSGSVALQPAMTLTLGTVHTTGLSKKELAAHTYFVFTHECDQQEYEVSAAQLRPCHGDVQPMCVADWLYASELRVVDLELPTAMQEWAGSQIQNYLAQTLPDKTGVLAAVFVPIENDQDSVGYIRVIGTAGCVALASTLVSSTIRQVNDAGCSQERRHRRLKLLEERQGGDEKIEFLVHESLVGSVIGKQGENLSRVARLYKVEVRVFPDEQGMRRVRLYGASKARLEKARQELEHEYLEIPLPDLEGTSAMDWVESQNVKELAAQHNLHSVWLDETHRHSLIVCGLPRQLDAFLETVSRSDPRSTGVAANCGYGPNGGDIPTSSLLHGSLPATHSLTAASDVMSIGGSAESIHGAMPGSVRSGIGRTTGDLGAALEEPFSGDQLHLRRCSGGLRFQVSPAPLSSHLTGCGSGNYPPTLGGSGSVHRNSQGPSVSGKASVGGSSQLPRDGLFAPAAAAIFSAAAAAEQQSQGYYHHPSTHYGGTGGGTNNSLAPLYHTRGAVLQHNLPPYPSLAAGHSADAHPLGGIYGSGSDRYYGLPQQHPYPVGTYYTGAYHISSHHYGPQPRGGAQYGHGSGVGHPDIAAGNSWSGSTWGNRHGEPNGYVSRW